MVAKAPIDHPMAPPLRRVVNKISLSTCQDLSHLAPKTFRFTLICSTPVQKKTVFSKTTKHLLLVFASFAEPFADVPRQKLKAVTQPFFLSCLPPTLLMLQLLKHKPHRIFPLQKLTSTHSSPLTCFIEFLEQSQEANKFEIKFLQ